MDRNTKGSGGVDMKRRSIFFLALFLICVFGGGILWFQKQTQPASNDKEYRQFVIEQGESVQDIAASLREEELIRSAGAFQLLVKLMKVEKNLQAGAYVLSPHQPMREIVSTLTHGTSEYWVRTIEGWRNEEIADYLEATSSGKLSSKEFLSLAQVGYMFPDSYLVSTDESVVDVVEKMKANFDEQVAEVREKAADQELSFEDVVILASIVEREVRTSKDRPIVAGILLRRYKAGHPLEVDATIQYALASVQEEGKTVWWKKQLTQEDLQIESPFNTRTHVGLPPTPISNPGLSSIQAVVEPVDSPYWYYVSDKNGMMHYAVTLDEHNINVSKYVR